MDFAVGVVDAVGRKGVVDVEVLSVVWWVWYKGREESAVVCVRDAKERLCCEGYGVVECYRYVGVMVHWIDRGVGWVTEVRVCMV